MQIHISLSKYIINKSELFDMQVDNYNIYKTINIQSGITGYLVSTKIIIIPIVASVRTYTVLFWLGKAPAMTITGHETNEHNQSDLFL